MPDPVRSRDMEFHGLGYAAPMRLVGPALISAILLALVACSSSTADPGEANRSSRGSGGSAPACPRVSGTLNWPAGVPRDLPKPPGGMVTATKKLAPSSAGGKPGVVVSARAPASLHDEVVYVTRAFPLAHFVLGRGDAEKDEADIPFSRGDVTGQLRLSRTGKCATTWILTLLPRQ